MSDFKYKRKPFKERLAETKSILSRYPGHLPIIAEIKQPSSIPALERDKYLVNGSITVAEFIVKIRAKLNIKEHEAIYLTVKNNPLNNTKTLREYYGSDVDADGFMYIHIHSETAFG